VVQCHHKENPNYYRGKSRYRRGQYTTAGRADVDKDLVGLFPAVSCLLELDLTGLLDEVTNVAAAGSEEVATTTTGNVIAGTSFSSLHRLRGG